MKQLTSCLRDSLGAREQRCVLTGFSQRERNGVGTGGPVSTNGSRPHDRTTSGRTEDSAEAGKACIILWANPTARRRCVLWPCVLRRHGGGARRPASVAGDWPGVDGGMARRPSLRQGHRFAMQKYPHLSGKFNPPTHFGEREHCEAAKERGSVVRGPVCTAPREPELIPPLLSMSWICCCRRGNKDMRWRGIPK